MFTGLNRLRMVSSGCCKLIHAYAKTLTVNYVIVSFHRIVEGI